MHRMLQPLGPLGSCEVDTAAVFVTALNQQLQQQSMSEQYYNTSSTSYIFYNMEYCSGFLAWPVGAGNQAVRCCPNLTKAGDLLRARGTTTLSGSRQASSQACPSWAATFQQRRLLCRSASIPAPFSTLPCLLALFGLAYTSHAMWLSMHSTGA